MKLGKYFVTKVLVITMKILLYHVYYKKVEAREEKDGKGTNSSDR